ncbi:MAG: hypothetical protein ACYTG6_15935, partial [Planctomycetota bacterium]
MRLPVLFALFFLLLIPACGDDDGGEQPATPPYTAGGDGAGGYGAGGDAGGAGLDAQLQKQVDDAVARARELLLSAQQDDGLWGDPETGLPPNAGYTAMAVRALIASTPGTRV